ncbi:hypothetical protein FACS189418_6320 [Clostridia bacterium]|nr:hypothetical protein FACS189418_6320 [Clostridia bacterium]
MKGIFDYLYYVALFASLIGFIIAAVLFFRFKIPSLFKKFTQSFRRNLPLEKRISWKKYQQEEIASQTLALEKVPSIQNNTKKMRKVSPYVLFLGIVSVAVLCSVPTWANGWHSFQSPSATKDDLWQSALNLTFNAVPIVENEKKQLMTYSFDYGKVTIEKENKAGWYTHEPEIFVSIQKSSRAQFVYKIWNQSDGKKETDIEETRMDQSGIITLNEDGIYGLHIWMVDKNGVRSTVKKDVQVTLRLDTHQPDILIEGVENQTSNLGEIVPRVVYRDQFLHRENTSITIQALNDSEKVFRGTESTENGHQIYTLEPITADDNYILLVDIRDQAGNCNQVSYSFSINQEGAKFVLIEEELREKYKEQPVLPNIRIDDVDEVTIVSFTVNGREQAYHFENGIIAPEEPISQEGKNIINLEIMDGAGHYSRMEPIEFYLDFTPPQNQIYGVSSGGQYNSAVTVDIVSIDSSDIERKILINDEEYTLDKGVYAFDENNHITLTLKDEGYYEIEVISKDKAGNVSRTPIVDFHIHYSWFKIFN